MLWAGMKPEVAITHHDLKGPRETALLCQIQHPRQVREKSRPVLGFKHRHTLRDAAVSL